MSIVATLIDKARQRAGIASDSALAAQFGVHRQAVSKWRNGDAYPDEEHIAEMALMAGDDPVQWLVAIKAVRAEGKAGKAWAALAKRLAAVTAGISVIALAYFHTDAPGALMALAPLAVVDPRSLYTLCEIAKASLLRRLRWIWLWITSCLLFTAD
ncbi:MAG: helix-turn-helix domain-containing protein [Pigmentiphaga sp.]